MTHRLDETDKVIAGLGDTMGEIKELLSLLKDGVRDLTHELRVTKERQDSFSMLITKVEAKNEGLERENIRLSTIAAEHERQLKIQWEKLDENDKWRKEVDADRNKVIGFWLASVAIAGVVSWIINSIVPHAK